MTWTNNKHVHPGTHACETVTNEKTHVDYILMQHALIPEAFVATEFNKIFSGRRPRQGVQVPETENFHTLMRLTVRDDFIATMFYLKKYDYIQQQKQKHKSNKLYYFANSTWLKNDIQYCILQTRRDYFFCRKCCIEFSCNLGSNSPSNVI